jgi:hypothetical protein
VAASRYHRDGTHGSQLYVQHHLILDTQCGNIDCSFTFAWVELNATGCRLDTTFAYLHEIKALSHFKAEGKDQFLSLTL